MEQKTSRRQIISKNIDYIEKEATIALAQQETKEQSNQNTIISGNKIPGGYLVTGITVDDGSTTAANTIGNTSVVWSFDTTATDVDKSAKSTNYYNFNKKAEHPISITEEDKEYAEYRKYLDTMRGAIELSNTSEEAAKLNALNQQYSSTKQKKSNLKKNYFTDDNKNAVELEPKITLEKFNGSEEEYIHQRIFGTDPINEYIKKPILNKNEELIINIEELADELANEALKIETNTLEYKDLLNKYKELILKHERAKKQ